MLVMAKIQKQIAFQEKSTPNEVLLTTINRNLIILHPLILRQKPE